MVAALMVNTAAIRIAYTRSRSEVTWRPKASVVGLGAVPAAASAASPLAKAVPANSMATNSRPLPRNTEAKNRSSSAPIGLAPRR